MMILPALIQDGQALISPQLNLRFRPNRKMGPALLVVEKIQLGQASVHIVEQS
jgi:hypothetical protein